MKKLLLSLVLLSNCFAAISFAQAAQETHVNQPIFRTVYPEVGQTLVGTEIFVGDRHGDFEGDYVTHLSDGSAWKIHPDNREVYQTWCVGDVVRIKVRTDWYWFKREHKFFLYNQTRGESAKVMLIQHINYPYPLKIVSSETYAKSTKLVRVPKAVLVYKNGKFVEEMTIVYESQPCDYRKILGLSDGSYWVIKNDFDLFTLGTAVYIGAQGSQTEFYDFVLIVGDQREAQWTYARPQR